MVDTVTIVSYFELAVGVVILGITALAWQYRTQPGGTPLVALGFGAVGWAVAASLASLIVDPGLTRSAQFAGYFFTGLVAISWFYIVVEYTGQDHWKRPTVFAGLAILVGLEAVSLLTNGMHHLYITEASQVSPRGLFDPTPGPLLWANVVWKVGLVMGGCSLLVRQYRRTRGVIRFQSVAIITSGLVPLITVFIELFDLLEIPGLDISTIGLAASGSILLWALFYAEFLELVPIARETLMENMEDAVVALDAADRVIDFNSRAETVLGGDDSMIGQSAETVFAPYPALIDAYRSADPDPIELTTTVGRQERVYELRISSVQRTTETAIGTDRTDDESIGRLVIFHDITDRKQRERTLETQNERLERFASIVSHDLRNPLGIANRRLELLKSESDSEHIPAIERAHDRMATLIDDLLALARTGELEVEYELIAFADFAETCWLNIARNDGCFTVESSCRIRADRQLLYQLLENLFRNAIEHGGEDVTITVGALPDDQGFYVEDDGVGIAPENRDRVFDFGYSTTQSGTGFGLAIVQEIALVHDWQLTITDSETGGVRVEVRNVETVDR